MTVSLFKRFAYLGMIAAFFSVPSFAGAPGFMKELTKALDLTPAQLEQVKEIRKKNKPVIQPAKKKAGEARKAFMTALQEQKKGAEQNKLLMEKFQAMQSARAELGTLRFQVALEVRELLTPEQLAKFKGLRGEFRGGRGHEDSGDNE